VEWAVSRFVGDSSSIVDDGGMMVVWRRGLLGVEKLVREEERVRRRDRNGDGCFIEDDARLVMNERRGTWDSGHWWVEKG
jgi:hypothetical protein